MKGNDQHKTPQILATSLGCQGGLRMNGPCLTLDYIMRMPHAPGCHCY